MKEVYGKIKFDGNNRDEILSLLQERHYDIVEKTFQNKKNLYANYCNSKLIGEDTQPHCRLLGYSVDEGRKSKSYAYAFQDVTGVFRDSKYFDFIPFAFTNTMDAIFINNNYNIENLRKHIQTEKKKRTEAIECEKFVVSGNYSVCRFHRL